MVYISLRQPAIQNQPKASYLNAPKPLL